MVVGLTIVECGCLCPVRAPCVPFVSLVQPWLVLLVGVGWVAVWLPVQLATDLALLGVEGRGAN